MRLNKYLIVVATALALAALAAWSYSKFRQPRLAVNTCLQDADGLRAGARVRIAGVDVGYTRVVRARPQDRACPAAVELAFTTNYELKIPRDSVVSTATAGILGETFLEIDISQASGPPVQTGERLPSRQREKLSAEKIAEKVSELLQKCETKNVTASPESSPHRRKEQ